MIYGVGINDVDDVVNKCPYYIKWQQVVRRCVSTEYNAKRPNVYAELCEEWKYFSKFKEWMSNQSWQRKEIDKDLLVKGNRRYSPETCVFVEPRVNTFINDSRTKASNLPKGCSKQVNGKIIVQVQNWKDGCRLYIGTFENVELAEVAWLKAKHRLACELAETQTDSRVIKALQERYL
jgi:hypothetical protein